MNPGTIQTRQDDRKPVKPGADQAALNRAATREIPTSKSQIIEQPLAATETGLLYDFSRTRFALKITKQHAATQAGKFQHSFP